MLDRSHLWAFCAALAVLDAERRSPEANITNFDDAIWWSITTMTSVGHGDRLPVTDHRRLVAAGLMLGGDCPARHCDRPLGLLAGRERLRSPWPGRRVTSVDRSAVQQEEGRRRRRGVAALRPERLPRPVLAGEGFDAVLRLFSSIGYRGEETGSR
jgi:Ion channel